MKKLIAIFACAAALLLTACTPAAQTASDNLSTAADNFEIERRIVFFNGITDKYLLTVEGRCSIKPDGGKLDVTCKIGPDQYKKHFLGLSDNVSYFVEQTKSADVSVYHYRVIFKPENIVPDLQIDAGKQ
ncbi:beta-sandwich lipoprotein [Pseudarthrobacter cellobiosi]|uniref:beta-sandwich lipoprotein n=1 Tax=Pseudarthrobacter cellobiosi TaxID=2953654 RepID=UPI00208EC537|nr:hypothetical protein [Pseudarthrobacter sp. HLT1-5]MCO4257389.1 hypothetical protein [Pseudarthrobacter sp. HLT1-5]